MPTFIKNRTQANVSRRNELSAKGWSGMTEEERKEWLGDPLVYEGSNLLPRDQQSSDHITLEFRDDVWIATTSWTGTYLYIPLIVGNASDYENKTLTLSVEEMTSTGGGNPRLAVWWYDENGDGDFLWGLDLTAAGTATFDTSLVPNVNNRAYLALYMYVTDDQSVEMLTEAHFKHIMLEISEVAHEYKPYTEIVPTNCTMGAYNYSDLNRVERYVAEISNVGALALVTKQNWTKYDIPTVSDMTRYLGNIRTIRDTFSIEIDMPTSMNNLHYTSANALEEILEKAYAQAVKKEVLI